MEPTAPNPPPTGDSASALPTSNASASDNLCEPEQRQITRLCADTGLVLLQHGAESALVESLVRRLGQSLGVDQVQVAIMANALTITTLSERHCITTVRRNEDRGINMQVVTEVQRAVLRVEAGEMPAEAYAAALQALRPLRYPRTIMALVIGLSCACFARLAGADLASSLVALFASAIAMYVRLTLASRHFNPLVTFFAAAFVATTLAAIGALYGIGREPRIAMASSVLLLVPGFPLINGISDMVKGYINTGISRLVYGTLLAAATCGGILLAMSILRIGAWL